MQGYAIENISPGLPDPTLDSQRIFRAVLLTMSRPGTVTVLGERLKAPAPLMPAAAAVCLALADMDTPVWLGESPSPEMLAYLRFHCGCPVTSDPSAAAFAVLEDGKRLPDLNIFSKGHQEYPDRAATLIIQVRDIRIGSGVRLTGPGIKSEVRIKVAGLHPEFWNEFQDNHACFPMGYDVILAAHNEIASLPRSVKVEV